MLLAAILLFYTDNFRSRTYADEKLDSRFKLVKLTEEPKLFPKKPEMSSLKTVSTLEEVDDTYERLPLRRQTSHDADVIVSCDVENSQRVRGNLETNLTTTASLVDIK